MTTKTPTKTVDGKAPQLIPSTDFPRYDILSYLFEYPREGFKKDVEKAYDYLKSDYPEAAEMLKPFVEFTRQATQKDSEELFTRSFDVQAITTLDIGYLMFGDDYKRAEILVNLNREHREAGNDIGNELSDNFANVLRLMYKSHDKEFMAELVHLFIGPCMVKMRGEFSIEKLKTKMMVYVKHHKTVIDMDQKYGTLYRCALDAVYHILVKDFGFSPKEQSNESKDFLRSINSELEIEKSQ